MKEKITEGGTKSMARERSNNREESQAIERRRGGELSRWEPWPTSRPFSMMRRIFDDMDRMMDRLFEDSSFPSLTRSRPWATSESFSPDIDVFERDGKLVVSADVPGLTKDDLKIDVTETAVIINGERKCEHEEREEGLYRTERGYGQFHREIPLPKGVKTETATANFKNGVLEIMMEAPQLSKARRRIQIQSEDTGQKAA
jgi:HSP20 family protein